MADSGPASLRSAPSLWRSGSDAHPRHPLILRGWCVPQGKAGGDSTSSLLGGEIWTDIVGGRAVVDENPLDPAGPPSHTLSVLLSRRGVESVEQQVTDPQR